MIHLDYFSHGDFLFIILSLSLSLSCLFLLFIWINEVFYIHRSPFFSYVDELQVTFFINLMIAITFIT